MRYALAIAALLALNSPASAQEATYSTVVAIKAERATGQQTLFRIPFEPGTPTTEEYCNKYALKTVEITLLGVARPNQRVSDLSPGTLSASR
jgi:hypothetical protein